MRLRRNGGGAESKPEGSVPTADGQAAIAAILAHNGNRWEAERRFKELLEAMRGKPKSAAVLALHIATSALYGDSTKLSQLQKRRDLINQAHGALLMVPEAEQDDAYWHLQSLADNALSTVRDRFAALNPEFAETMDYPVPLHLMEPVELADGSEVPLHDEWAAES